MLNNNNNNKHSCLMIFCLFVQIFFIVFEFQIINIFNYNLSRFHINKLLIFEKKKSYKLNLANIIVMLALIVYSEFSS